MSNLAFRDPATLVEASLNDRRRLAQSQLFMLIEDGVDVSPVGLGQVIRSHALLEQEEVADLDVMVLGDKLMAALEGRGRRRRR